MRRFKTQSNLTRAALMLLVVMLTTATAWAYDFPATGSCGPNATYTINDSTMTISGTGEISNHTFYYKDLSGIKSIVINEGITDIGNFAFSTDASPDLTSVNLPASLINISQYAFEQCAALTTVNIAPNSQLQTIGEYAFDRTALTSIDLSGCHDLTSIANGAFYQLPLGGALDLSGCTSLSSIGEKAFAKTSITSLSLPASLISLDKYAFDECRALSTVTIADGSLLTTIGNEAFRQCYFESIVLPCAGLTRIGDYAFSRYPGQNNLTEIICLTEKSLSVDSEFSYNKNQVTVYMYASKKVAWEDAKAVKGLFTITPDESITDINGIKIYGDYYAEGTEITVSTNQTAYGFEVNGVIAVDAVSLGNNQYQLTLPNNITTDNVTLSPITLSPLGEGDGSEGNPYIISDEEGWEYFCDALQDNDTWNRFSGKTVRLGADISVTRMAGSSNHDFCGTFDGNHKTITFNYGSKAEPESGISALFSHTSSIKPFGADTISPATIKDQTVDGTIWTSSSDAAGFVGRIYGTLNLTGCTSNIAINSTADFPAGFINYSDQTSTVNISGCTSNATINTTASYAAGHVGHLYGSVNIEHSISNAEITAAGGAGGFVGLCEHTVNFSDCLSDAVIHSSSGNNSGFVGWSRASGHAISFTGCVFNGKLLQIDSIGNSNGGFIGWTGSNKTVTITNCLVDPAALAQGETMATSGTATFSREHTAYAAIINNSYFTDTLGAVQGKQAHSIIAGDGVTVGFSGTATEYGTSGITAYGTGIMYNGVLYAGINDEVSLNLDGSANGYSVNAGTLTGEGNPFTLLMPDENVTITTAAQFQRGDVNHDGHITIADVTALIDYLLSNDSEIPAEANVNGDSTVSIADVTALIDYLLSGAN